MNTSRIDRRVATGATGDEMGAALTELQQLTLERLRSHGWRLQFVRSDPDEDIAIVYDPQSGRLAVVEADGHLNMKPGLKTRQD